MATMTQLNGGSSTNPTGFEAYYSTTIADNTTYTMVHNFGNHVHQVYTANDIEVVMTIEGGVLDPASASAYISAKTANMITIVEPNGGSHQGDTLRVYAKVPHSISGRVRP